MARMLSDKMSTDAHLNSSRRHQRLCKQTKGAEKLVNAIETPIKDLEQKQKLTLRSRTDREASYDDNVLFDGVLDDIIRNVSDSAKQFDRNNPGRKVYGNLFPEGGYASLIKASLSNEPDQAEQLLQRLKGLEPDHPLLAQIVPLTDAISNMKASVHAYRKSITEEKNAIAQEELAQAALRKQYEFNFLDAVKLFGKSYANRLFPRSSSRKQIAKAETVPAR